MCGLRARVVRGPHRLISSGSASSELVALTGRLANTSGGSRHGDARACDSASRMALQTRSGVHGMSRCRTPRWLRASTTAFCTAGVEPTVADSPMPLAPSGLSGVGVSVFASLERGQLGRARHRVVGEVGRQRVPLLVVDELLPERLRDPLGEPAVLLAVDEQRVEDAAAVVDRHVADRPDLPGLHVDLDHRDVGAEREGRAVRCRVVLHDERLALRRRPPARSRPTRERCSGTPATPNRPSSATTMSSGAASSISAASCLGPARARPRRSRRRRCRPSGGTGTRRCRRLAAPGRCRTGRTGSSPSGCRGGRRRSWRRRSRGPGRARRCRPSRSPYRRRAPRPSRIPRRRRPRDLDVDRRRRCRAGAGRRVGDARPARRAARRSRRDGAPRRVRLVVAAVVGRPHHGRVRELGRADAGCAGAARPDRSRARRRPCPSSARGTRPPRAVRRRGRRPWAWCW